MTFDAILSDFYARMNWATTPPAARVTHAKRLANEAHRELLRLPGVSRLRDDVIAISATANQARTGLPQAVARLRGITDRTNGYPLDQVSLATVRRRNPTQADISAPRRYAVVGWQPVALHPSNASELFVKSDAAGDTGTAYLEGIRSDGSLVSKSVAMTGVTAVSFSSVETGIVEVTKFYLSTAAVGNVTLREDSGAGTELARIPIGRVFAKYLTVEWDAIPSATQTFYADVTRHIPDLVQTTDEPLLPEDFHDLIGVRMRMWAYEGGDDSRRQELKDDWDKGCKGLMSWVVNDGDAVSSLRPIARGWSSLGATYPAGS